MRETRIHGAHGLRILSGKQAQPTQKYDVQPANRGSSPWTDWAREVRNSQPDYRVSSSNTWHASAGGAHAWGEKWSSQSSGWSRSYQWSAPTTKNLAGSDYDTDHEWHASTMRYSSGWANDPTWSQRKRAKPTYTDPEDDRRADPTMPSGSTTQQILADSKILAYEVNR